MRTAARMRTFIFDPTTTSTIGQFIKNNSISFTQTQQDADAVVNHLFPAQSSSATFDVQLHTNINWVAPRRRAPILIFCTRSTGRTAGKSSFAWMSRDQPRPEICQRVELRAVELVAAVSNHMATPAAWSIPIRPTGCWTSCPRKAKPGLGLAVFDSSTTPISQAENSLFMYKLLQPGDFLYSNALTTSELHIQPRHRPDQGPAADCGYVPGIRQRCRLAKRCAHADV